MPDVKIPHLDVNQTAADLTNALKEAAYIAVGLGVLGFQRAQVQRVEWTKQLEEQLAELKGQQFTMASDLFETQWEAARTQLVELAKEVDERVAPSRAQIEDQFNQIEERLPEAARDVFHSVRAVAAAQERTLRYAIGLD